MSSTNKTTRLGLNKWVGSDIPKMEDFNRDNDMLEDRVGGHIVDSIKHVTMNDRYAWSNPYNLFSYIGNGESNRTIQLKLGFEPCMVIVFAIDAPAGHMDVSSNTFYNNFGIATIDGAVAGLELEGNELRVSSGVLIGNNEMVNYNAFGTIYMVIGFR